MLYVQQSLGPNEEIIMGARFHWMYTLQAIGWIMAGLAAGMLVGYAMIWWTISADIRAMYPGLPAEYFDQAWSEMVAARGGYLKILWGLHVAIRFAILGAFVIGLWFFAHMMIIKATTEIAVTSERIIYKKGLISRHVGELNIDRIEGVAVRQDLFGRIFNYGRILIRGMGVGEVLLPPIEAPIDFRRAIQEAKSVREKSGVVMPDDL